MKKIIYIFLSVLIGLMLAGFVGMLLEWAWIKFALSNEMNPAVNGLNYNLYLPLYLEIILLIAGIVFGLKLGFWGWRVVYVEHRHWRALTK